MLPVPIPNTQLEIGNIGIGNIFTLATFNKENIMKLQYKTVLTPFQVGGKAIYRAVPMTNGTVDLKSLASKIKERTGLDESVVKYVCELIVKEIVANVKNGKRVNIANLLGAVASIKGAFPTADAPFDAAVNKVVANVYAKDELNSAFEGIECENVTQGNHVVIRRVLDTVLKENGKIMTGTNVTVYVSGLNLAIDPAQEDEGCWLENATDGTIVATGEVTGSTSTTLDAKFATVPAPGVYNFVVASRGGLGPEFGVSIARRSVEVVEA